MRDPVHKQNFIIDRSILTVDGRTLVTEISQIKDREFRPGYHNILMHTRDGGCAIWVPLQTIRDIDNDITMWVYTCMNKPDLHSWELYVYND